MKPFAFLEPSSVAEVIRLLHAGQGNGRVIAGGSDLLAELKDEIVHYERLVSLARVGDLNAIEPDGGGLRLGALVTLSQLEHDPRLTGPYRILAGAARGVATPEIRNQGTLGGNLCQRPRCLHYRSALLSCRKKNGADCPALNSPYQNYLSVMGGHGCYAVNASDLAPPLIALNADVVVAGPDGVRSLPLVDFFAGPEKDVRRENILNTDELLTTVIVPSLPSAWRGTYLKARERSAGDFPLVSVAAGFLMTAGTMHHVRMVLGGVAPVPWPCPQAERLLEGQAPRDEVVASAAEAAFADASPLPHNGFKVAMGRALVARAIYEIQEMAG